MKKRIRITESELHNIVKKCVNEALNEVNCVGGVNSRLNEDYGYDEDDEWKDVDNGITNIKRFVCDIKDGNYDTKLQTILNRCNNQYYSELFYDLSYHGYEPDEWIGEAAEDRLCVIDKDYAFKNARMYPYNRFRDDPEQFEYSMGANYGIRGQKKCDDHKWKTRDGFWKKHEEDKNKQSLPNFYKVKNGYKGMTMIDALDKDLFGTNQYNKRPLHRKGSLNRAFDEDSNLSESKLHNIIKRCVNNELKKIK